MTMSRARHRTAALLLAGLVIGLLTGFAGPAAASAPRRTGAGPVSKRSAEARQLLPYPGAPPLVPHEVEERKAICQECHVTGEQGAPITPHPTRTHFCIQCHVGQDPTAQPFPPGAPRRR